MPSRRDQIKMTDDELRVFLAEQKIVTVRDHRDRTTGRT